MKTLLLVIGILGLSVVFALAGGSTDTMTATTMQVSTEYALPATDGSTDQVLQTNGSGTVTWEDSSGLWEVDGTETQLVTADELDMRSKKIINVTDPVDAQDVVTKAYAEEIIGMTAGDTRLLTADAEHPDSNTAWTKVKEVSVALGGTYRIYFEYSNFYDGTAYASVARNGALIGTTYSTTSNSYIACSQDLGGFSSGDLIQLYTHNTNNTWTTRARYFRISGNKGVDAVILD